MNKNHYLGIWIIIFIFFLLAGITRFYRLDWSFWGDEPLSFIAVRSLVEKPFFLQSHWTVDDYIARACPVGVALQALSYKLFGTTEVGSRMGVAIAGALIIPLCVLLTSYLYDRLTGILLGFILVLSPWHLFHAQNNRVYAFAFFFGSLALLAAAFAWKHNSMKWAVLAGIVSAINVSTHNFTIVIPLSLAAFVIFEYVRRKGVLLPWRAIMGYILFGVPLVLVSSSLALIAWFHVVSGSSEVLYTSLHTLMALAFNLDWGIALFACAGWAWAIWDGKDSLDRIWISVVTIGVLLAIVAPLFLPFRHDYLFPIILAFFILAARVVVQIYESIKERFQILAVVIVIAFLLLPLPSFISYYQDGDRPDYRAAAKFIMTHYQSGDIITDASWTGVLRHYLPFQVRAIPYLQKGSESISELERIASSGQRFWLVCSLARQELPLDVDRWLWENAVRMLRIKKKRFDYHENITDVYLVTGSDTNQKSL